MRDKKVRLIQKNKNRWELVSPTGHVMLDNLQFYSEYEAVNWCKSYVSSFNDWRFELVLLKEKTK
jgi:hypothetical protein